MYSTDFHLFKPFVFKEVCIVFRWLASGELELENTSVLYFLAILVDELVERFILNTYCSVGLTVVVEN